MRFTNSILIILACLCTLAPAARSQSCPIPLLVVEQDGSVSSGSKERLHSAVQMGFPLRVGMSMDADGQGKDELSHWADALFVTSFEGEIFTQFAEIRRQTPKSGERHIELSSTPSRWTGSIGTDGFLEGAFDDNQKPFRLRVRSTWCIDPRVPLSNIPASLRVRSAGQPGAKRTHQGIR
jgi:hypothetical protein